MGKLLDHLKQVLDPEVFEEYRRRCADILEVREEIADKFRDLNPPGMESVFPDAYPIHSWFINWVRERGGLDLKTWDRLEYEEFVEWAYRIRRSIEICKRVLKEKPPAEELIKPKWLSHLCQPPAYLVRADVGFPTQMMLFGKFSTVMWAHVDYWRCEFVWVQGYHNEDGVPVQYWVIGIHKSIADQFDREDVEKLVTPSESVTCPPLDQLDPMLDRRHLRKGVSIREIPRKIWYNYEEWMSCLRDIELDLREEMFPKWTHATLYASLAPGHLSNMTQHNFWTMCQWWSDPWFAIGNAVKRFGFPMNTYGYGPLPPILNTLIALPREIWTRRLTELHLVGPKRMLCDAILIWATSKEKTPLKHEILQFSFKGGMYKNFAIPYDDGIPPPRACLTALSGIPTYKEANMRDLVANPENLSKEYKELLESEAGVDLKTWRIPPYQEVPRLKWLFDPTIEWFKPTDFPPFEWEVGQVWPVDITREKMELMVEEGYDGSGERILHYSSLADKKMGQLGKTIMLGTMPYKLPVCGCSPQCS